MANWRLRIGVALTLVSICLTSIGLYLVAHDSFSQNQIRKLLTPAYNQQRPGGGRLSGSIYTPTPAKRETDSDLGSAQILLLRRPESDERQDLQGQIYLAAGDWQKFVALSSNHSSNFDKAARLNNLGASFLALADTDTTLFLKALDAFEQASKMNPRAPEPLFNLVIVYRKLHFSNLADETLKRYAQLDSSSPWYRELANPIQIDEGAILDELRTAVEKNDRSEAERLFEAHTELCRRAAMQFGIAGEQEEVPLLQFIAEQMERRYHDKTIAAMLAPLFGDKRDMTVALRDFVNEGAEFYKRGNFPESLAAYAEADKLVPKAESTFDRLWVDLNRVDTQIRMGQFDIARESLLKVIASAQAHDYVWLTARALSVYGATVKLTASYGEMIELLEKADRMFVDIGAPHDRLRVLYYLSAYRYGAGDEEEALRLALECLRLTSDGDALRIYTVDWLIGSILYRRGMLDRAVMFAKESVQQSQGGSWATAVTLTATSLARLYESMAQHSLADHYLGIAEDAFQKIPEGYERSKTEILLELVEARSRIDQKRYSEAESLLQKNLQIYYRQPFPATELLAGTLMLFAQLYSETGRVSEAAEKFNKAIAVVENDGQYLKSEGLRVKFDDSRRELYDSAIEFEFTNGALNAAWTYLQKYRAKLFLEFLAAFNPRIEQSGANPDAASVQRRIPKDTQVVEYALLKDRLLIWIISDNCFTVRSVAIKRADLETQIETVLKRLRAEADADELLVELDKSLIEPVSMLLNPNKTLVIIPDRALNGLPFGALRRPGKNEYLIQEFPIVVSPSLTYFLAGNEHIAETPRDAIVGFGSQNGGSAELKELSALSTIYGAPKLYAGEQVTKSTFLSEMSKAAIFHYAGHSATDAADPLRSSILLDGNRSGPNSVTAVDISRQHLAGNAVVILSSCDSSVGNSRDGIGVRGLTSAFLIGGAGAVVGSLWPVEETSTADLMIRFHRAFAGEHMPVAQALREAQLSFLRSSPQRSHPYYWSGFVVTGNFSALR